MKGMGRQMEGKEKSKLEEGKAISEGGSGGLSGMEC